MSLKEHRLEIAENVYKPTVQCKSSFKWFGQDPHACGFSQPSSRSFKDIILKFEAVKNTSSDPQGIGINNM